MNIIKATIAAAVLASGVATSAPVRAELDSDDITKKLMDTSWKSGQLIGRVSGYCILFETGHITDKILIAALLGARNSLGYPRKTLDEMTTEHVAEHHPECLRAVRAVFDPGSFFPSSNSYSNSDYTY